MLNLFQAQRFYMCSHFYLKYSLAVSSSFGFQFKCHLLLQLSYPYSILVIPYLLTVLCFYGIFYYLIKYHLFLCSLIYCLSLFQDYKLSMVSLYWFVSRQIRALYVIAEHVKWRLVPQRNLFLPHHPCPVVCLNFQYQSVINFQKFLHVIDITPVLPVCRTERGQKTFAVTLHSKLVLHAYVQSQQSFHLRRGFWI